MSKALQNLREALYGTGLVQPLDSESRGGFLSVLCRQVPGQEKGWLAAVDALLETAEAGQLDIHVCRRYVRKNGRMVFGWYLGVTVPKASGLVTATDLLTETLKKFHASYDEARPAAPPPGRRAGAGAGQNPFGSETPANRGSSEPSGEGPKPPPGVEHKITVVSRGRDKKGNPIEVTEMPLGVYRDLNAPTKPGGRGARGYSGGDD